MSEFDYVVVGAGSAGCVVANRLSADGRHKVLLLEAGPKDNYLWIHIPIGYGKTMFHKSYNWGFYTDPEPNMHGRQIYWPRGRGLGGSSSINGLICIRGQSDDYDHWAQLGNAGWDWKSVLPYFMKSEHNSRGASATHGGDGPLWMSDIREKHELMEAIIRGAEELGVPRTNDFNSGDQEGVGYFQLFTRNGWRNSSAAAYLKPVRDRANLRVETDAHTTGLVLEGRKVVGVRYRQGGVEHVVRAAREVILSAGALQSPQLLQLSGIGPAETLRRQGIEVVHDLPGVGKNLQDHLQFRLMFKVSKPITTNDDLRSLFGQARIGLKWLLTGNGPLGIGINQGGLFTKILPGSKTPDIQFHFGTLSADQAGGKPHDWSGCTFSVCQLRPESRGVVEIKSADPMEAPSMRPNYLAAETDRICAVEFDQVCAQTRRDRCAEGLHRKRIQTRRGDAVRCRDSRICPRERRDHLPSCRHLQDGVRRDGGNRCQPSGSRHRQSARGRLFDHADHYVRKYSRARGDDRRESLGHDPGRGETRRSSCVNKESKTEREQWLNNRVLCLKK